MINNNNKNTEIALILDTNALVHRAFHALPPLTSSTGDPVNALYGLARIFLKILNDYKPNYVIACFDRKEKTDRKKIYEAYKAKRPPLAPELISQLIEARNLAKAFGFCVIESAGFEADDLIGSIIKKISNSGMRPQIKIITGDHDTLQLVVGNKVTVVMLKIGITTIVEYDEEKVIERYGVEPK